METPASCKGDLPMNELYKTAQFLCLVLQNDFRWGGSPVTPPPPDFFGEGHRDPPQIFLGRVTGDPPQIKVTPPKSQKFFSLARGTASASFCTLHLCHTIRLISQQRQLLPIAMYVRNLHTFDTKREASCSPIRSMKS